MSIDSNMKAKLHTALRNDFWFQWLEAIAEEYDLFKTENIDSTAFFNDIYQVTSERLIDISKKFGYTPNLILDSSREFLEQEVLSIAWKILNKSTVNGYNYIFKTMPYRGNVYNLYYDDIKLIHAVNYPETITALGSHDPKTVFYDFVPDLFFSAVDNLIRLDEGNTLDEDPAWELDNGFYYIYSAHLAIEAIMDRVLVEDSTDYLMLPDYMAYLLEGSKYNRKATDVPHVGGQLNIVTDESGYFDYSLVAPGPYSVDDLKLKSCMTPYYVNRLNLVNDNFFLDEGDILDDNPAWTLDAGFSVQGDFNPVDSFKYLVAGTGEIGLASQFFPDIFKDAPLYYSFDNETGEIVQNLTSNLLTGTIFGDINRVPGIISKTLNWDGNTFVYTPDVEIGVNDFTYSCWAKVVSTPTFDYADVLLFHQGYSLNIAYDTALQEFQFVLFDKDFNFTFSLPYDFATYIGQDFHLICEIDGTTGELRLFVNGVLQFPSLAFAGADPSDKTFYVGYEPPYAPLLDAIADDVMYKYGFLTQGEKDYIYNNKLGGVEQLGKEIYREELSPSQIHEDPNWYIVHGVVKGVTSQADVLGPGDGTNQTFKGVTELDNIFPGSFRIYFTDQYTNFYEAYDDGEGVVSNSVFNGTIDYTTGEYEINTFKDTPVVDNISYTGQAINISFQEEINIVPGTYSVKYNLPGATYIGTDDGLGNITGTELTGTINYTLGTVNLVFTTPTESGKNILSSYSFRRETWIPPGENMLADYKVSDPVEITEVGIKDEYGRLLAYANFPPVKLDNINYHLGANFMIRRLAP